MSDDDEPARFFRMDGRGEREDGSEDPVISTEAFQAHGFAIVHSVRDGTPGFISDDYLNAISADTTIVAAELCLVGLWRRVDGGYSINDPSISDAVDFQKRLDDGASECERLGGHRADADRQLCETCLKPLDDDDTLINGDEKKMADDKYSTSEYLLDQYDNWKGTLDRDSDDFGALALIVHLYRYAIAHANDPDAQGLIDALLSAPGD